VIGAHDEARALTATAARLSAEARAERAARLRAEAECTAARAAEERARAEEALLADAQGRVPTQGNAADTAASGNGMEARRAASARSPAPRRRWLYAAAACGMLGAFAWPQQTTIAPRATASPTDGAAGMETQEAPAQQARADGGAALRLSYTLSLPSEASLLQR